MKLNRLVLTLAVYFLYLKLIGHPIFRFTPLSPDDYFWETLRLPLSHDGLNFGSRPMALIIVAILNSVSVSLAYFVLHIILLFNIYLTYIFVEGFFRHFKVKTLKSEKYFPISYLLYLSISLSFFYIPSYTLSLSPIVSLLSYFFAISAGNLVLFSIEKIKNREFTHLGLTVVVTVILTSLSLFSKEDFILYLILINSVLLLSIFRFCDKIFLYIYLTGLVITSLLFLWYTFIISANPHVVSQDYGYSKTVNLQLIALRSIDYLLTFGNSRVVVSSLFILTLFLLFRSVIYIKVVFFAYIVILSTVIPYAILIEKFNEIYVINWWFFICAILTLVIKSILIPVYKITSSLAINTIKIVTLLVIFQHNITRPFPEMDFYLEKVNSIRNISIGLVQNKSLICSRQIIAISLPSPDIYNPWAQESRSWLRQTVGCNADWLIFTAEESYTFQNKNRGLYAFYSEDVSALESYEFSQDSVYVFELGDQYIATQLQIPVLIYNLKNEFVSSRF